MVSLCYHVQREGCGFWEAEWDSLMITSGAGHNYLLLTLHGLSEAQKTGQSLCCPLLKIITQKTAIKTLPAMSSSSSPWHSLYHFSSKWTVSTLKSTYSLLLSSLVNLYFSSCRFAQSKILLVQCGVHAGISSVINPKLDWKDHCQFGVRVLPRLGKEKNACPTWPGWSHFRFLGSCSAFLGGTVWIITIAGCCAGLLSAASRMLSGYPFTSLSTEERYILCHVTERKVKNMVFGCTMWGFGCCIAKILSKTP